MASTIQASVPTVVTHLKERKQKARPNQRPHQAAAVAGRRKPRRARRCAALCEHSTKPATLTGASHHQPTGGNAATRRNPKPIAASCGSQCTPGRGRRRRGRRRVHFAELYRRRLRQPLISPCRQRADDRDRAQRRSIANPRQAVSLNRTTASSSPVNRRPPSYSSPIKPRDHISATRLDYSAAFRSQHHWTTDALVRWWSRDSFADGG